MVFLNFRPPGTSPIPEGALFIETTRRDFTHQFFTQYQHNKLRIDAEYRRYWRDHPTVFNNLPPNSVAFDVRSWYVSGAHRINKWLELGTYHSRYYPDWNETHTQGLPGTGGRSLNTGTDTGNHYAGEPVNGPNYSPFNSIDMHNRALIGTESPARCCSGC